MKSKSDLHGLNKSRKHSNGNVSAQKTNWTVAWNLELRCNTSSARSILEQFVVLSRLRSVLNNSEQSNAEPESIVVRFVSCDGFGTPYLGEGDPPQ